MVEQSKGNTTEEVQHETVTEDTNIVTEEIKNADDVEIIEESETSQTEESGDMAKIQQLEGQLEEANNRLLRVQADYDNFRRRTKEEREAAAKYKAQSLVEGLLPVLDNFERALSVKAESDETKSLLQGMEMVHRQLQDAIKNEGVEVIETVGQTFDPHVHQAVMQVESDEYEANHVVDELQKGYRLKDRVVRPAMVKVSI